MKITLWQLNQGYPALMRLAAREFPKEHHKLAYAIARFVRSAKPEIDLLAESLNDLMRKCGFEPGQPPSEEVLKDYNERALTLMKESDCELWGDPIPFDKFAGVVSIVPMDLVLLDWLIVDDTAGRPGDEASQSQTAGA